MRRLAKAALIAPALALSACYHAIVETGRPAGTTIIEQPWANSFIGGLVPPTPIQTASQCTNGVSRVETQHSFLNQLAGFVTLGIYTPMTITVTCAAAGTGIGAPAPDRVIDVAPGADIAAKTAALDEAAKQSAATGEAVFVRF